MGKEKPVRDPGESAVRNDKHFVCQTHAYQQPCELKQLAEHCHPASREQVACAVVTIAGVAARDNHAVCTLLKAAQDEHRIDVPDAWHANDPHRCWVLDPVRPSQIGGDIAALAAEKGNDPRLPRGCFGGVPVRHGLLIIDLQHLAARWHELSLERSAGL